MDRHRFLSSCTSALMRFALIFPLGPVRTTEARSQAAAPKKPWAEAREDQLERLRPNVRLGKVPSDYARSAAAHDQGEGRSDQDFDRPSGEHRSGRLRPLVDDERRRPSSPYRASGRAMP